MRTVWIHIIKTSQTIDVISALMNAQFVHTLRTVSSVPLTTSFTRVDAFRVVRLSHLSHTRIPTECAEQPSNVHQATSLSILLNPVFRIALQDFTKTRHYKHAIPAYQAALTALTHKNASPVIVPSLFGMHPNVIFTVLHTADTIQALDVLQSALQDIT